jgi:2-methylcitrate dehydratase PrpD
MSKATLRLAEFSSKASPAVLPSSLYFLAKRYLLDTIGVTIFGSTQPWSQMVARFAEKCAMGAANNKSSILGAKWRATAGAAALVNGTAGHAFELDDVHDESLLHPGTVVVPAALAVCEDVNGSGTDLLTSIIVGYELIARAGLAVGSLAHMMGGFHSTGTNGVFGSAAAAASLRRLDAERTANAFGVAGSLAGGIMEFSQSGGMVKRLHAGRAAEGGVLAAYLAADGFTGPHTVLEGMYGYCATFSSKPEPERLLADLGNRFAIEEITVKPYACCSDQHGTIDCIAQIRTKAEIAPEQVKRIVIHTYDKVIKQNAARQWPSVMSAQYSVIFTAAASFFHDLGDPRSYSLETIADPRIAALAAKVELVQDPRFQALYPRKMPTRVEIETISDDKFEAELFGAKGHFDNPMSVGEIEAKFRKLTDGILSPVKIDRAIEAISTIENAKSIVPLMGALRVDIGVAKGRHAAA